MSVSRLQAYSNCGLSYKLQKLDKAPERQAVWFIQGTAVHAALEAYERSWRALPIDPVLDEFRQVWDRELAEAREKQPDPAMWMIGGNRRLETDIEKRHEQGLIQVQDYVSKNPVGADLGPAEIIPGEPAIEVGFQLKFGEVEVLGYIDFVRLEQATGRLIPEDWKTGRNLPTDPYQLATYKFALEDLTGQSIEWGRYWMCRDGGPTTIDLRKYTREEVEHWYKQLVTGINNQVFLPNPGDCFTCTVRPSCKYAA
jgi:putative RecB family exonuclease